MSHATVLVAVTGDEDDIEKLVAHQMEPFMEGGAMFADGSRWDWYQIGGRWNGLLNDKNAVRVKDLTAEQKRNFPAHYAFLRNRTWHEQARMGWFGGTVATECEIHKGHKGKCLHRDEKSGAAIVSWDNDPNWDKKFYDRFIKHLPPDTWLVTTDFHV